MLSNEMREYYDSFKPDIFTLEEAEMSVTDNSNMYKMLREKVLQDIAWREKEKQPAELGLNTHY